MGTWPVLGSDKIIAAHIVFENPEALDSPGHCTARIAYQRFVVRLCAGRTAQWLNLSSLATECGITHNTAKAWISVLEASYLVFLLRPHYASFNKCLVKMPKLYF